MATPRDPPPPLKPDDYFRFGPFEMARFGKQTVMTNNQSPEEHAEYVRRLAEHYDEVMRDIDTLVSEIAAIVARCDPVALLKRAWWENAAQSLDAECEAELGPKHLLSQRMLDYVQCVIVSTAPLPDQHEPSDGDWSALAERVEKLFSNLALTYHLVNYARRRSLGAIRF